MSKEDRQKLRCTHCNECFRLHGYPDWYKELKRGQEKAKVNCVDHDMDTMSDGGRYCNGENGQDIGKLI